MKTLFAIGHNDLRLFLKHKSAYIWLFAVPLAFVYFMGFAARGPGQPANHQPPVAVENLDPGFLGQVLLDGLGGQGLRRVDPASGEQAGTTLRIPTNLTRNVLEGRSSAIELRRSNNPLEADATIVEARLIRALIALNGHLIEAATPGAGMNPLEEATLRELQDRPDPVGFEVRFAGRKPVPSGFNFSLPGNLVMYLMMNLLIFGGATVAAERRSGVIRRLFVHPVRAGELVMGKIYGLLLLGVVQIGVFLVLGRFVFGVNLGANLPGVTVTLLVFAWVAASLGVLLGSVVASPDRVAALGVLTALLMAALGGCWWPLEAAPPVMKTIALCLPTGWALEALHRLISFGSGLGAVTGPLAVLAAFGTAANLLAARWFRC